MCVIKEWLLQLRWHGHPQQRCPPRTRSPCFPSISGLLDMAATSATEIRHVLRQVYLQVYLQRLVTSSCHEGPQPSTRHHNASRDHHDRRRVFVTSKYRVRFRCRMEEKVKGGGGGGGVTQGPSGQVKQSLRHALINPLHTLARKPLGIKRTSVLSSETPIKVISHLALCVAVSLPARVSACCTFEGPRLLETRSVLVRDVGDFFLWGSEVLSLQCTGKVLQCFCVSSSP